MSYWKLSRVDMNYIHLVILDSSNEDIIICFPKIVAPARLSLITLDCLKVFNNNVSKLLSMCIPLLRHCKILTQFHSYARKFSISNVLLS